MQVLTGLSPLFVTTPQCTQGRVKCQSSLRQDSHFSALQETAPRLTNGEDSRGTGQNMLANYANKWRSPPVMAGGNLKVRSGLESREGE